MQAPLISIIIPTLNEASGIQKHLTALQPLRQQCEIIVADGGSMDGTQLLAESQADHIIESSKGRARQMNSGAKHSQGDILLFLHADTCLPDNALSFILEKVNDGYCWGRFDITLTGSSIMFNVIGYMMNWRSRLTSVATGDQGLFVTREAFDQVGQFPDIALMEDIAISKKLKRLGKPACLRERVVSSGRRWEKFGLFRTILLMWWLRILYYFGTNPNYLSQLYSRGIFWKP